MGIDPADFFLMYLRDFHPHLIEGYCNYFLEKMTDYPSLYMMRSLMKFLESFDTLETNARKIGEKL